MPLLMQRLQVTCLHIYSWKLMLPYERLLRFLPLFLRNFIADRASHRLQELLWPSLAFW